MSTDTETVGETTTESPLELLSRWYHVPVVGLAIVYMFASRARGYEEFITDDGRPMLAAVDSWYHWRTVEWTAENYPWTMPYEIYTSFPTGRYVGQFGTLFDQLIVTVAMVVGLGDPSTETLYLVSLLSVPAMAALVAIPVFFLARRLGGTFGGVVAVVLLALFHGSFFSRSTAGQLQHHAAEVLFMAIAVLAMMVALRAGEQEQPIWELVVDRDWEALRRVTIYSVLAGVGLSLYLWVWPSGVILTAIFGAFLMVHLTHEYLRGNSPDHIAYVGAVSMAVPTVFMLLKLEAVTLTSTTSFGLLQPLVSGLVVVGCVFMAWLAREWDGRGIERAYYPGAIVGSALAGFVLIFIVSPDLFNTIINNITGRLLPVDPGVGRATIEEAQQPDSFPQHAFEETGLAFYTMLAGIALLLARPYLGREYRAEHSLFIIWALFLTSMAMTQLRFGYYFVLPTAVGTAILVREVLALIDLESGLERIEEIQTYQVITIVVVVGLLFVPLLPPMADTSAWERGGPDMVNPHPDAMVWEESNQWLQNNTPEPGDWAGAGNADELEYFGSYDHPGSDGFDYPEGAYGVMSWWDYGHLITVQSERIPHSNPFQSNAVSSSTFLTAQSEERAELIMDAISVGESPDEHTNEELEEMIGDQESHEELRYVMIDASMATDKMPAITEWQGPDYDDYRIPEDWQAGETVMAEDAQERFSDLPMGDTMTSKLYLDNADGLEHYRLVHENSGEVYAQIYGLERAPVVSYALVDNDQVMTDEDGDPIVEINRLAVPGTQTFDLLQQAQQTDDFDIQIIDESAQAPVKTFERVEGATLTGNVSSEDVEENTSAFVYGAVETNTGEQFPYSQEAAVEDDGTFEVTVPYATDNELDVDDGYTNTSVMADEFFVGVGELDETPDVGEDGEFTFDDFFEGIPDFGETEVPESAVLFGEDVQVDVEPAEDIIIDEPEGEGEQELPEDEDDNGDIEIED